MKNLFVLATMVMLVSCSPDPDLPEPVTTIPTPTPTTVTCSNSTWMYEVVLATPMISPHGLNISYRDSLGNMSDTSYVGMSSWTKSLTMQYGGTTSGSYPLDVIITPIGAHIENTITINIYKNGLLVESNNSELYCWDDLGVGCDPQAVFYEMKLSYECS